MITFGSARPYRNPQRGMATMAMTLVLLVLLTMVAAYTGRSVLFEQRVSGNDFRARQAFEAAESGLQVALAYLSGVGGADRDGVAGTDPVFDTNGDGIGDSNTFTFADLSSVTVTVTGGSPAFDVMSIGVSDDRRATRTVRSLGRTADGLPRKPDLPLTARGTVVVDGSATVFNPEGNSTIWSGTNIDIGSNNATATQIADPTDPGYPACMDVPLACTTVQSSNRVSVGLDVIEHDTSLGNLSTEQTFQNFFGMSMENYRASRVSLEVLAANVNNLASNPTNPGVQLATGEIVWVEGDAEFSNNTTVGCTVVVVGNSLCANANIDASIVIINGDLIGRGTPNITGLLYVIGNFELQGNLTAMGAVVVTGDFANDASGSLDVVYNSAVLDATRDNGPLGPAPGGWRDW
jgi:hypothetical protein